MKIAASIYSGKQEDITELIKMLDEHLLDFFHIDCNDDLAVFEDIVKIRELSSRPIDLHIISPNPEKFYNLIVKHHIENVTFQYENLIKPLIIPSYINSKIGLAIVSDTPIEVFETFKNHFDHILFMSTTPGVSGGKFDQKTFNKIRTFSKKYPKKRIHVDGGVNPELSFILRNMGVQLVVVGSYLFKSNYLGASLLNLKSDNIESHYLVKDFMLTENLPTMSYENSGLKEALDSIEKHNMGFTVVIDNNGLMCGIITNADIRRALIKNFEKIPHIGIEKIMNTSPVFINECKTVTDLLLLIRSLSFPLLYLPVTDQFKKLTGVITFNNLIKGES